MVNQVHSKNAEEIAERRRKHTEEVATLVKESAIFVKNHEAVASEIIHKEQEKSATLIAKHTEEIAALNNRAEQTNEKNLEAWTKLNNKYVESQLKVANMEPDYNSYQA